MHSTKGWAVSRIRRASYWRTLVEKEDRGSWPVRKSSWSLDMFGVGTKVWNEGSPYSLPMKGELKKRVEKDKSFQGEVTYKHCRHDAR